MSEIQEHVNYVLKLYLSLYNTTNGLTNSFEVLFILRALNVCFSKHVAFYYFKSK